MNNFDNENYHKNIIGERDAEEVTRTPGPWFIGKNNPLHQTDVLDERGDLIARVASSVEHARLIAAAPELLAVTVALKAYAWANPQESLELRAIINQACDAIAKAKGR